MFSKKRPIQQFISLIMACMLLVVAIGGRSFSGKNPDCGKDSVSKDVASKTTKGKDSPDQVKVGSLDLKAVVTPVISFNFLSHFHFILPAVYRFVEVDSVFLPAYQVESHYFFSYLKKVFSHHIAINAP
jgi:hypothetical protein